jgi:hypothetical protein
MNPHHGLSESLEEKKKACLHAPDFLKILAFSLS